jgi:hypothetical protein
LKERCCVFVGTARAGKTALGKDLYADLHDAGRVPLWINGSTLKRRDAANLDSDIQQAIIDQYGKDHIERFKQLEPHRKAIVIDDFHRVNVGSHRRTMIESLMALFGTVILLVDEEAELAAALNGGDLTLISKELSLLRIRALGHLKREELIRRWCTLGEELIGDEAREEEEEIAFRVAEVEKTINTLLGRKLLPPPGVYTRLFADSRKSKRPENGNRLLWVHI